MSDLSTKRQRRYPRIQTQFPLSVDWEFNGEHTVTDVTDLNMGGVFIYASNPAPIGASLNLSFSVPEGEIKVRAIVRDVLPVEGMGVEFLFMDNWSLLKLVRLYSRLSEAEETIVLNPPTSEF